MFLRKVRSFNKSRYARNRQLSRVIFYFAIYVNVLLIFGIFLKSFLSQTCFVHVQDLRRLRHHLTQEAMITAANALVGSRLDYCNSLFHSLSAYNMRKLQCVQNSLARVVTNTSRLSHISPVRKQLHWLPIEYRCIFKTALLRSAADGNVIFSALCLQND